MHAFNQAGQLNGALDKAFNANLNDCADTCLLVGKNLGIKGMSSLDPAKTNADSLLAWAKNNGTQIKSFAAAQALANKGALVIGGLTSTQLGSAHGHVLTLSPGKLMFSGNFGTKVPNAMNSSLNGNNFRNGRISGAFPKGSEPVFFHISR